MKTLTLYCLAYGICLMIGDVDLHAQGTVKNGGSTEQVDREFLTTLEAEGPAAAESAPSHPAPDAAKPAAKAEIQARQEVPAASTDVQTLKESPQVKKAIPVAKVITKRAIAEHLPKKENSVAARPSPVVTTTQTTVITYTDPDQPDPDRGFFHRLFHHND